MPAPTAPLPARKTTAQNAVVESVELSDAPLGLAINLIRQKTGINVAIKNGSAAYGRVTLSIRRKPISDVLRLMAESAGADFWEENGVFWFGEKGSAPKKDESAPALPVEEKEFVSPAEDIQWEKVRLSYINPHELLHRLGVDGGPMGTLTDQFTANVLRMLANPAQGPTTSTPNGGVLLMQNSNGGGNYQNVAVPAVPTGNQAPTNNGAAGNAVNDQTARRDGDDFADFGRGGQFGGQPGGGAGGGQRGGQNGQGGGAAGGLLPDGIQASDLLAYDADGSLIVRHRRGDQVPLRRLKELIQLLDVKPRQIMIKAEFVTVNQNDESSFGISWNFQKVNLAAGTSLGVNNSPTAFLQYAAGNLQTQLSWILTTGRGKVVAAPMATTLNNVPVSFQNQTQIPYYTQSSIISNNGTAAVVSQVNFVTTIRALSVLPRINGDDTITLFGNVQIADQTGSVTGPNGETTPILLQQTAPVQRIIRNGDTLVIGGLTSKTTNINTARTPLLGDLPILGTLFRSRSVAINDSDLLVFITAAIIPDRPTTSTISGGGGGNIPGIPGGPGGAGGGLAP